VLLLVALALFVLSSLRVQLGAVVMDAKFEFLSAALLLLLRSLELADKVRNLVISAGLRRSGRSPAMSAEASLQYLMRLVDAFRGYHAAV
jgi:hypothetical protein